MICKLVTDCAITLADCLAVTATTSRVDIIYVLGATGHAHQDCLSGEALILSCVVLCGRPLCRVIAFHLLRIAASNQVFATLRAVPPNSVLQTPFSTEKPRVHFQPLFFSGPCGESGIPLPTLIFRSRQGHISNIDGHRNDAVLDEQRHRRARVSALRCDYRSDPQGGLRPPLFQACEANPNLNCAPSP